MGVLRRFALLGVVVLVALAVPATAAHALRLPQTITFAALSPQTLAQSTVFVNATASSGLAVVFATTTPSVCTSAGVNGQAIFLVAVGTCTVRASQSGNTNIAPAKNVNRSFAVSKASQSITFDALFDRAANQSPFVVWATASSGLAVSFTTTTPSVCGASGTNGEDITLLVWGRDRQGFQPGNTVYNAAANVSRSFWVSKAAQSITFAALPSRTTAQSPFTVSATASSGLPVVFSTSTPWACTSSGPNGSTITLVATGWCTVKVAQPGNAAYYAAVNLSQSFLVTSSAQSITFGALPARTLAQSPFTVIATATSGLPVTFTTSTPTVCTSSGANGETITLLVVGTCTVRASQPGDSFYGPATSVNRSFVVKKISQSIIFGALPARTLAQSPFTVSATATSGLPVTFIAFSAGVCTAGGPNGETITLLKAGKCTVRASQSGDATYAPALSVNRSFMVS